MLCVLLAGFACAECVEVEGPKPTESSDHVRVVVTLAGKPLSGVRVGFYLQDSKRASSEGASDQNGVVITPKLNSGDYTLVATLDDEVESRVWVQVKGQGPTTTLKVDLAPQAHEAQRADGSPLRDRLQAFAGTVRDVSGAGVSNVRIRVIREGVQGKAAILRFTPDANGGFAADLPEGRYIAFFFSVGFRPEVIPFELTRGGSGDLHVALQVGAC